MADADSLESLEYQLKTINESLAEDPGNKDMLELKAEMENLISLTKEYTKTSAVSSAATASRSANAHAITSKANGSSSHMFTAGTEVLAKWQRDGKMYPARIASVSGSSSDPVYTVIFDIDKSTEVVRSGDIKAMSESRKRAYAAGPSTSTDTGDDKESKKQKKVEKKVAKEEDRKARVAEQVAKQSTWQSFAKKGAKKGIQIPGVNGTSMFKSPDTVTGRVGVVGSGKGMTTAEQKKRYKLGETLEE